MELNLCNLGLSQVPSDVWFQTNLRKLDLSGNRLTELPYEISYLTELKVLNVSNNRLTELPYQISYLTALQELDVRNNRLTELPYQLEYLTKLRKLAVAGNPLDSLPYGMAHLLSQLERKSSAKNTPGLLSHKATKTHADTSMEQAKHLLQNGQERAAGVIAGIELEAYLKGLCAKHSIPYSERAGLQALIQNLEDKHIITSKEANHMTHLSSIRNKCAHSSPVTKQEVKLLVQEVKKLKESL